MLADRGFPRCTVRGAGWRDQQRRESCNGVARRRWPFGRGSATRDACVLGWRDGQDRVGDRAVRGGAEDDEGGSAGDARHIHRDLLRILGCARQRTAAVWAWTAARGRGQVVEIKAIERAQRTLNG